MKRLLSLLLLLALLGTASTALADTAVYPKGTVRIYCTGQPQFLQMYYEKWLEDHRDIAPEVNIEILQIESMAAGRQKISMDYLAGAYSDMPDGIYLDPVGIIDLASANLLLDVSDFYSNIADQFIGGAAGDATIQGKVYGLPEAVRPQLLFYNSTIFEQYGIDPATMSTFDGYIEAGRQLKEKSNGEVFLSYVSPTSHTWRYWGRRGLMPQANARIWDEQGNVVIGEDAGAKLALGVLDTLVKENLLYKTAMMQPPLYEATDNGKIATFYIGAFWDEFLRANLTKTAGQWRVMNAPVFTGIEKAGAPVSNYLCLVNNGENKYAELIKTMWLDFQTDIVSRNAWVSHMEEIKGAYSNPISLKLLADPFWQAPSEFYGGQSFRKAEGEGLNNAAANMVVTAQDGEADTIISAEIEKYVAGEQDMDQAIQNMDKELKNRIKQAIIP